MSLFQGFQLRVEDEILDDMALGVHVPILDLNTVSIPLLDYNDPPFTRACDGTETLLVIWLGFRRFSAAQAARFAQFFRVWTICRSWAGSAESVLIVALSMARLNTCTI